MLGTPSGGWPFWGKMSTMERRTRQRDAIWRAFETADRPLSPQEVLAMAQTDVPGLGIATVYRALSELAQAGRLALVELPGDGVRYEAHGKGHHHHFLCRKCDRVFDFESCPGKLDLGGPRGFVTESHEIILHGLCADCR